MSKVGAFILILITASIISGVYGIIHDQLTYSMSKEYYTKFKFIQFGFDELGWGHNIGTSKAPEIVFENPRLGVSIVGVLATWWVGLIIGILLAFVGLIHRNGKDMFAITFRAIVIAIVITAVTGVLGLVYGKLFLVENPPSWFVPDNLHDKNSFVLVGSIHNFSYLGSFIGLVTGVVYSIRKKRKNSKKQ